MDVLLIAIAFLFGLVARQFRLPPLVGFLVAGFVLQTLGKEGGETLRSVSDLGVTLLLFSIGLKLRVRSLMRPEIWGSTTLHAGFVVLLFAPLLYGAAFFFCAIARARLADSLSHRVCPQLFQHRLRRESAR